MTNYTSIEQSKKLLELGLSPETADFYYDDEELKEGQGVYEEIQYWVGNKSRPADIPCWSVGVLLDLMPKVEDNYPIMLRTNNFKLTYADKKGYCIRLETGSLLDVCYNMMIWLLENGYINTK